MLRSNLAVALAGIALATASAGSAQALNILTMTEQSSSTLGIVASFEEVSAQNPANTVPAFSFSGNITFPGNDSWAFGSISLLLPTDTYDGSNNNVPFVAWREPGSSTQYNLLKFHPDGNQGYTYFEIYSDLTLTAMAALGFGSVCRSDGVLGQCPILNNGQSYDLLTTRLQPNFGTYVSGGTLRVTFNDLGDIQSVETPLPAALPLFATGLAGLGWLARRRRKQAA
jgi:hypothetical protein